MDGTVLQIDENVQQLITMCQHNGNSLIICTDTNAHSTLWGCELSDDRGHMVEDLISTNQLQILNTGNEYTFETNRSRSIIDVTIVNDRARNRTHGWNLDTQDSMSDHKYIEFTLDGLETTARTFRNIRKADWATFRTFINARFESGEPWLDPISADEADNLGKRITDLITEALDQVCPLKPGIRRQPMPWWSTKIAEM